MPKYAPANEAGEKPYVVEWIDWARPMTRLVYARDAASARFEAVGRARPGVGTGKARRATFEDLPADKENPA